MKENIKTANFIRQDLMQVTLFLSLKKERKKLNINKNKNNSPYIDEEKAAYKMYTWNETLYQSDNTKGWVLVG